MDLETFQQQALPFEFNEHFDQNKSPENGEEYLQRVILERKKCPRIVCCKEPTKFQLNENGIQRKEIFNSNIINHHQNINISDTAPHQLRTTKEWQQFQIEDFTKLQNKIINLRNKFKNCNYSSEICKNIKLPKLPVFILSTTNWWNSDRRRPAAAAAVTNHRNSLSSSSSSAATTIIVDAEADDKQDNNYDEEWYNFCKTNEPFLSIMFSLDQRTLEYLIELLLNWLTMAIMDDDDDETKDIHHNNLDVIDWIGKWIYSGLACLLLPLEPYTHSILRDIAKLLIKIRNQLTADDYDKALPLNLLICVISNNFQQLDLSILPINEHN